MSNSNCKYLICFNTFDVDSIRWFRFSCWRANLSASFHGLLIVMLLASLPKSALNKYVCLNCTRKAQRLVTLIVYQASPNAIAEMNWETNTPRCRIYHVGTAWAVTVIYKQNERHIVLIPLLEIGDFDIRDKARNAFLTQGFLPSGNAKIDIFIDMQYKPPHFFYKNDTNTFTNNGIEA